MDLLRGVFGSSRDATKPSDEKSAVPDTRDILHASTDAAIYVSNGTFEDIQKEEKEAQQNDPQPHIEKELEERVNFLENIKTSVLSSQSSQTNFMQQITNGIGLAAKASAKEKSLKDSTSGDALAHTVHKFVNPNFGMDLDVKEYCPQVFRALRDEFNIPLQNYVEEWTLPASQLKAAEGAGRSGALFCFSASKKFILKTIFKSEVSSLLTMLKDYYHHCCKQPNTLIMRILGVYRFSKSLITLGTEIYVLVFGNVNWSGLPDEPGILKIDQVYDLKGRRTKTLRFHDEGEDEKGVQKDKHLSRLFYTGKYREELMMQLHADVTLLNKFNLMDYSLLIGVHQLDDPSDDIQPTPDHPSTFGKSIFRQYRGGFPANGEVFFIGIIDCLTYYGTAKFIAHSFKSLLWSKDQLSTVQTQFYAERFLHYAADVFPPGEAPEVHPFNPCEATTVEDKLILVAAGIRDVYLKPYEPCPDLQPSRFTPDYHNVSKSGQNGEAVTFSMKNYAPTVFARLCQHWGVEQGELSKEWELPVLQIQANSRIVLDENGHPVGNTVPSSSKKYLVETIQQRDLHCLIAFLPAYTEYMLENESTLTKIVGLFKCSTSLISSMYFIVCFNPEFCSKERVIPFFSSRMYKLQGVQATQPPSIVAREESAGSKFAYYYDKNLDRSFSLGKHRDYFLNLLKNDVKFLQKNFMILYSLVIYVGSIGPLDSSLNTEAIEQSRRGLVESEFGEWILFGGIQCLWKHYGKREIVTSFPRLFRKQETIATVEPNFYAERFIKMAETILTR